MQPAYLHRLKLRLFTSRGLRRGNRVRDQGIARHVTLQLVEGRTKQNHSEVIQK
jgi:hypothetical protein